MSPSPSSKSEARCGGHFRVSPAPTLAGRGRPGDFLSKFCTSLKVLGPPSLKST